MPHFRKSISIVSFVLSSFVAMQIRYFVGDFILLFINMQGIYTDTQFHRFTSPFLLLLLLFVKKKFTIAKKLKQNSNKRAYGWRKIERKIKRRTKQIRLVCCATLASILKIWTCSPRKRQNFFLLFRMASFRLFIICCVVYFSEPFGSARLTNWEIIFVLAYTLRSLFTFKCKYKQQSFFFFTWEKKNDRWNANKKQSNRVVVAIIITNKQTNKR